jgi:predicted RNase H-like nuclease
LLYTLNGQRIYQKRGTRKGLRHRMELVASVFPDVADFFRDIKEEFRRNEVEEVDIVRAAALAWGAVKSVETGLTTVPEEPDVDSEGMKRAIHLLDR